MARKTNKIGIFCDFTNDKATAESLGINFIHPRYMENMQTAISHMCYNALAQEFPQDNPKSLTKFLSNTYEYFAYETFEEADLSEFDAVMLCGEQLASDIGVDTTNFMKEVGACYDVQGTPCFIQLGSDELYSMFKGARNGKLADQSKKGAFRRAIWITLKCLKYVRGTSLAKAEVDARWVGTMPEVLAMIEWIQTTGMVAYDTETMPKESGVPQSDWLKHNTSFWLAKTRCLLFSPQTDVGFIVPSFDPESPFTVGQDSYFEAYRMQDILVHESEDEGDISYEAVGSPLRAEDWKDIDQDQSYYVFRAEGLNAPVTDYLERPLLVWGKMARYMAYNITYCKEEGIDDLWEQVRLLLKAEIFEDTNVEKILHNFSFDRNMTVYERSGIAAEIKGLSYDTMHMFAAVDKNDDKQQLKPRFESIFPQFTGWGDWFDSNTFYVLGSLREIGEYGAIDSCGTFTVYLTWLDKLVKDERLYAFWRNARCGVQWWFADLQLHGDYIDIPKTKEVLEELEARAKDLEFELANNPAHQSYILQTNSLNQKQALEVEIQRFDLQLEKEVAKVRERIVKMEEAGKAIKKNGEPYKAYQTSKDYLVWLESEEKDDSFDPAFYRNHLEHKVKIMTGQVSEFRVWNDNPTEQQIENPKAKKVGLRHIKTVRHLQEVSLTSNDEVGAFIYDQRFGLGFPLHKVRDKGKVVEKAVTDSDELYWMAKDDETGWIEKFMEWRGVHYMKQSAEELLKWVDPWGYVHSSYNFTNTDRTRSYQPNRQNDIQRTSIANNKPLLKRLKSCTTVPHPEYQVRAKNDLEQAEIRVYAEVFGITGIANNIKKGYDLHKIAAKTCLDYSDEAWEALAPDEVAQKRVYGKIINFGLLYGMSAKALQHYARTVFKIELSLKECKLIRHRFLNVLYPEIGLALEREKAMVVRYPYAETLFKSRRDLSRLTRTNNPSEIAKAGRFKVNTPVQGTAGIFMYVTGALSSMRIKVLDLRARFVNIIHDDLPTIFHIDDGKRLAELLRDMAQDPPLEGYWHFKFELVQLDADTEFGPDTSQCNWDYKDLVIREKLLTGETVQVPAKIADKIETGDAFYGSISGIKSYVVSSTNDEKLKEITAILV